MRIFKSIFLSCWISLLLCACSSDAIVDTDGESSGVTENTLITVYFKMPGNTVPDTRAIPNAMTRAEEEHFGTETENTVSTVNLILVEATPNGRNYTYGNIAAVVKEVTPTVVSLGKEYCFTAKVSLPGGFYRIFLIANPDNSTYEMNNLKTGMTFEKFTKTLRGCSTLEQLKNSLYSNNHFLMTNQYASNNSDITECKPGEMATVTLQMQRAAARIDYIYNETNEDTKKNIFTTDVALYNNLSNKVSIRLTQAALFNISRSFYYFKHISADETADNATIDASATEGNFVIDTDWSNKEENFAQLTTEINENTFPNIIEMPALGADNFINYIDVNYKGTQLFYTSENTVPTDAQLKRTCTGVLLKGEFGLDENQDLFNDNTDILVHNHIIYPAETEALNQLSKNLTTEYGKEIIITKDTEDAILKTYNVQRFTREDATKPFVTYYPVFMRHRNNNDNNVAGPMEFSVVRNTIYRFRVKSISGLGPDIDPEDPVEEPAQIDIEVSVADWVDRDIEFDI